MTEYSTAEEAFRTSLVRAQGLCELQEYLSDSYSRVLDTSDMLRASVVLSVSSFDFLIHEIYRIEVLVRYKYGNQIKNLSIPFNIHVSPTSEKEKLIDRYIREANSYKSFVDPGKYSEAMSCFIESPWDEIAAQLNGDAKTLKQRLRAIYRWRNRIAHEADINPVLAGVELWPIEKQDVLEPDLKVVERYHRVVIHRLCREDGGSDALGRYRSQAA